MDAQQFREVRELFDRVVQRPPSEWESFLATIGARPAVRAEVERLLREETADFRLSELGQAVGQVVADSILETRHESGQTISHYQLVRKLGEGGMGEVWLADDLALGRPTAIKLLRSELHSTLRARLRREAEASARLQHPGIATFYEAGEKSGTTWLAMECVEGPTLRERLNDGRLPAEEALPITAGLLEALVHAHTSGVVHRDIKPENVILTGDHGVKLLDFGLAKWTEEQAERILAESGSTKTTKEQADKIPEGFLPTATAITALTGHGMVAGTLGYMSPEQLRGDPVDVRTDLFAVGAVLYEMLAGRPAFPGATARERIESVMSADPQPLPDADIPAGLDEVLRRALARDSAERYADAPSLLADLRRVSAGVAYVDAPNTLAVLTFDNLTGDPDNDWIGTGLADGLATILDRVSGIKVLSRERVVGATAVLEEPGDDAPLTIARLLGCHLALTGCVERLDSSMRITIRLRETGAGEIVAMDEAEGTIEDLLAIQARLAGSLAESLDLTAASPEAAPELNVFECYNRGKALIYNFGKERMQQARELFERALALDPEYVPALADLSVMHAMQFSFTTDPAVLETAAEYARRALRHDPGNGAARAWLGYSLWRQERHGEALAEELRAIELASGHYMGHYFAATILMDTGRSTEALPYAQAAVELFPKWAWGYACLAWCHLASGNRNEARWSAERCVAMREIPGSHPYPQGFSLLAEVQRREGQLEVARESALHGIEEIERTDHAYRDSARVFALCILGRVALDQGDLEGARAAFDQAVAQMRGRPDGIGVGNVMVQTLAGQTRAGEGPEPFEEALALFERRGGFNFSWTVFSSAEVSLNELARSAATVGRTRQARELLDRGRRAGLVGLLEERL